MPKNYWMFVQTPENFELSKELGFTLHGLRSRQRRRVQRMEPDDRVLYYVSGLRKWTATASIASRYFEDRKPIWKPDGDRDPFPYRVKLSPAIVLDEADYIDALLLAPGSGVPEKMAPGEVASGILRDAPPAATEGLPAHRSRDEADRVRTPTEAPQRTAGSKGRRPSIAG